MYIKKYLVIVRGERNKNIVMGNEERTLQMTFSSLKLQMLLYSRLLKIRY